MGKVETKKHYDANTTKVLKSKVIARIKKGAVPQKGSLDKYEIDLDELNKIRTEVNLEPIEAVKEPRKRYKAYSIEDIKSSYDANDTISDATKTTHFGIFKNLLGNFTPKDYYKKHKFTEIVENEDLNPNTAASSMAAVLSVLDTNPILLDKVGSTIHEMIKYLFNELKVKKDQFNITRQQTEEVEPFSKIVERIEADNARISQEVLLINLYDNITARNDFGDLSFDTDAPNHVNLEKGTITITQFKKTNGKYPPILDYRLNKKVLDLLKMHKAMDHPNNLVFQKQIRSIFKKAKIGIDMMRHSKISEELAGSNVKDADKREELRQKMFHSPLTQMSYIRQLKV
jgi:hypothetical protein